MSEATENVPERNPEELRDELVARARYYAKGFGDCLLALRNSLSNYLKGGRKVQKVAYIKARIQEMVDLYEVITPEFVGGGPDCDLLLGLKTLIAELEAETSKILAGEADLARTNELVIEISDAGDEFRVRLNTVLSKLRECPGYENFDYFTTDMNGDLWRTPFYSPRAWKYHDDGN